MDRRCSCSYSYCCYCSPVLVQGKILVKSQKKQTDREASVTTILLVHSCVYFEIVLCMLIVVGAPTIRYSRELVKPIAEAAEM